MADWDAGQYLKFADERTRPAADLLARVPLEAPARAVDLGCGPGNSTALLAARFPEARITGLDSSPAMLEEARRTLPAVTFVEADLAAWEPDTAPDLIFANAVLQWLPDHAALLPRLAGFLAPGGCLAVQVPDNLDEPSHRLMREVAEEAPFREALAGAAGARTPLGTFQDYDTWLARAGCTVDLWRTTYVHPLQGHRGIVEWCALHRLAAVPGAARSGDPGGLSRPLRGCLAPGLSDAGGRAGAAAVPAAVHRGAAGVSDGHHSPVDPIALPILPAPSS